MSANRLVAAAAAGVLSLALAGEAAAIAIVPDGGWISDSTQAAETPSDNSAYTFELTNDAYFRVTDAFATGDTFFVFDGSDSLLLTTSLVAFPETFGDNASADSGWTSDEFSSGELLLGPGSYSLSVEGDCGGGCPAGYFVRLDTVEDAPGGGANVPLPAAAPLLAAALGALGLARRRGRRDA
ncbi:MAG: VPLPA-CTERM sorting domain-containing protein [Pseudomonadota bacterium]